MFNARGAVLHGLVLHSLAPFYSSLISEVEQKQMTNKLIWRLKEQPTTESLRELVKDKILTNEEARQILFSSETEESRDKASLENEIKFLRDLVEKLSQDRSRIIEVIKEVKIPYYKDNWYHPYQVWCGGTAPYSSGTTTFGGISNQLNGVGNQQAFASIKTF